MTKASIGGATEVAWRQTVALQELGYNVSVGCGTEGGLTDRCNEMNISWKIFTSLREKLNPFRDLLFIFQLRKFLKENDVDAVLAHSSKPALMIRLSAIGLSCNRYSFIHGWSWLAEGNSIFIRIFAWWAFAIGSLFPGVFINVCESDKEDGKRWFPWASKRFRVVRNGIAESELRGDSNCEKIRMVSISRLAWPKDFKTLFTAMSFFKDKNDWSLAIYGNGPYRENLEKYCKDCGVSEKVKFLGEVPNACSHLNQYNLFVLPTIFEGLPVSIIEALRAGLPIVASNVNGIPELVKDGTNGILCRRKNVEDWRVALDSIFIKPKELIVWGRESRKIYEADYREENMILSLHSILSEGKS